MTEEKLSRCPRCGRNVAAADRFCSDCGMFLQDAFVDRRLLMSRPPDPFEPGEDDEAVGPGRLDLRSEALLNHRVSIGG